MKAIFLFSILSLFASAHAAEEQIGDSGVNLAIAVLKLDLKNAYPNKSDVWWIGHRKCMAETVDIVFSRDQLFNMAMKLPTSGKEAVLRDPNWTKFKNLLDYCQTKADSETGR
jgi:hypothetical protein